MQRGKFVFWVLVTSALCGGVAFAADALVETDEEHIEALGDALTGPRPDARVDDLLSWIDPGRVPLVVRAGGHTTRFDEGGDDPGQAVREALAPLRGEGVELVQRSIAVEGDEARLSTRVRVSGGLLDVDLAMQRDGQGFWVREVRVLD